MNLLIFQAFISYMQGSQSKLPDWFYSLPVGYYAFGWAVIFAPDFHSITSQHFLNFCINLDLCAFVIWICSSVMGNSLSGPFPTVLSNITSLRNLYVLDRSIIIFILLIYVCYHCNNVDGGDSEHTCILSQQIGDLLMIKSIRIEDVQPFYWGWCKTIHLQ